MTDRVWCKDGVHFSQILRYDAPYEGACYCGQQYVRWDGVTFEMGALPNEVSAIPGVLSQPRAPKLPPTEGPDV